MPSLSLNSTRSQAPSPVGFGRRFLGRPSVFLFVILTAQLMVVLDATVVNVALPHIQGGLHLSGTGLSWVLNAYILAFGGLLLLGARAGDLAGRRRIFLGGIALFSVSSMLGGVAATGWMLLAARGLQGVGAALAAPSALSLLTTRFAEGAERVRAIALYTTMSAAGGAIGLVAGGLLTQFASWRWVMFVNVPIGAAVWVVGRLVLDETEGRHGRFDVIGALSSTAGMAGIVLGLVEAGSRGWSAPVTVVPLVVGAALLTAFVRTEQRAAEPILPLRLLAHGTRNAANAARGLVYAGMFGMFFYLSQFLQDVQHLTPLQAGVAFLPVPGSVFLASQLTSRLLIGRISQRLLVMMGVGFTTLGLLTATRLQVHSAYGQILVSLVLLGTGAGISFVSLTSASLADVAPEDAGAASGLINVSQQVGGALGLAVLVSAFSGLTGHAQWNAARSVTAAHVSTLLAGLHDIFAIGALFTVVALGMVAWRVRSLPDASAAVVPAEVEEWEEAA